MSVTIVDERTDAEIRETNASMIRDIRGGWLERQAIRERVKRGDEVRIEDYLVLYPRLASHLMCTSLGYLSPRAAGSMIRALCTGQAFWCEWTYDILSKSKQGGDPQEAMRKVTRDIAGWAFRGRHHHKGYMADYLQALTLVLREIKGMNGPMLAGWF